MEFMPCLVRSTADGGIPVITLGHPLLDDYLAFVAARARTNTWLAVAFDLKVFFDGGGKAAGGGDGRGRVRRSLSAQRAPRRGAGSCGWRMARRAWRHGRSPGGCRACGACMRTCAPGRIPACAATRCRRSLAARRPGARRGRGGVPLIRTPRTLPRVLAPAEVDALRGALRTHRDRAMVDAMVLGGLRRCEVLGLRLEDLSAGERRLFVAEGKGGRQRVVPVSARFFAAVGAYLESERPRSVLRPGRCSWC